jgi:hypothetical protein
VHPIFLAISGAATPWATKLLICDNTAGEKISREVRFLIIISPIRSEPQKFSAELSPPLAEASLYRRLLGKFMVGRIYRGLL